MNLVPAGAFRGFGVPRHVGVRHRDHADDRQLGGDARQQVRRAAGRAGRAAGQGTLQPRLQLLGRGAFQAGQFGTGVAGEDHARGPVVGQVALARQEVAVGTLGAVGYALFRAGRISSGDNSALIVFFAGVAAISIMSSLRFAKKDAL